MSKIKEKIKKYIKRIGKVGLAITSLFCAAILLNILIQVLYHLNIYEQKEYKNPILNHKNKRIYILIFIKLH